jgi:diguanylate cyclase (GGDEF)-like protein/PAS domain S-box-containing protein
VTERWPDGSGVEAQLMAALEQLPDALIEVLDAASLEPAAPEVVERLPLGHRPVSTREILPLIDPASHPTMFGHPFRLQGITAPEHGYVADPISFLDGQPGIAMLFDLRASHGVFVGVVSPTGDEPVSLPSTNLDGIPTKVARLRLDSSGTSVWADESAEALTGYPPADLVGTDATGRIHPDDRAELTAMWLALVARPDGVARARVRHRHAEGRWIWVELTLRNKLTDPDEGTILVEMLDIDNEMALVEEVRRERAFFAELADTLPVGVLQIDEARRVAFANDELASLTGHAATGDLDRWLMSILPPSRDELAAAIDRVLASGGDEHVEIEVGDASGARRVCATRVRGVRARRTVAGALISLTDVTSSVRQREELERLARRDTLTGLLNREAITLALDDLMASDRPAATGVATIFIDLDGFKPINDTFGHATGDDILIEVAHRLRSVVREGDLSGRLGGDEFVVVCRHAPALVTELAVAERIRERLSEPIRQDGVDHRVTVSVGVAWTDRRLDAALLVTRADTAMYAAKRAGGDRVRCWSAEPSQLPGTSPSPKVAG